MIERTPYQDLVEMMIICLVLIFALSAMVYASLPPPPPPPPPPITPTPTPTPTPELTPAALPTLKTVFVDPFTPGLRSEGQWYKWHWVDFEGKQDLKVGIIVYRHAWLDGYTWYNNALGQYMQEATPDGMRYFIVWVHEEMLGNTTEYDPAFWGFDESAFILQLNGTFVNQSTTHNPVNRIKEFNQKYDYYNTVTAEPFAWKIILIGRNHADTSGYVAQRYDLRMGQGNAWDGYIIWEVPENTKDRDLMLLGQFQQFGHAVWTFGE